MGPEGAPTPHSAHFMAIVTPSGLDADPTVSMIGTVGPGFTPGGMVAFTWNNPATDSGAEPA